MIVECGGYDEIREEFKMRVIGNLARGRWEEITNQDDRGISFILGLEQQGRSMEVVEDAKEFLGKIWRQRRGVLEVIKDTNKI